MGAVSKKNKTFSSHSNILVKTIKKDMARTSGLKNKNFVKLAVLEKVIPDSPIDERNL